MEEDAVGKAGGEADGGKADAGFPPDRFGYRIPGGIAGGMPVPARRRMRA